MKRGGGSAKGSSFEREICKRLSLWWTEGERDDVFWRTAGSGGRATNRLKQGKGTSGAYGDLTFTDPIGADLFRVFCFELKRGYGDWDVLSLIDRPPTKHPCVTEKFWKQARRSCADAGALYPMVIFRRDKKVSCVMSSRAVLTRLSAYVGFYRGPIIQIVIGGEDSVFIMPLENWLDHATPRAIRKVGYCE